MHLKTRLTLGVVATASAVGALLVPATDAFAAPALTADPSISLYNGAITNVSGTGLPPSTTVALAECNLQTAQTIGLDDPNVVFEACSTDNAVLNAGPTDASGNLPATPFTVKTGTLGTDPTSICDESTNGQCVIAAGDPNTFQLYGFAPISFSSVTADPNSNLTSGQQVSVTGAGLPPSTTVAVLECDATVGDATGCNTSGAQVTQTDADGNLPATVVTVHTGQQGSAGSCDASNDECVIAVANPSTGATYGFAPIAFAFTHAPTSLSIGSSKDSVDKGEKFVIKGRDVSGSAGVNGVKVKLQSSAHKSGPWSNEDSATTKSTSRGPGFYKFGGLTERKTLFYRVKSSDTTVGGTIFDGDTSSRAKVRFTG